MLYYYKAWFLLRLGETGAATVVAKVAESQSPDYCFPNTLEAILALQAVIGLIEAVFVLWIACIIITAFSATSWGQQACDAIGNSVFLSLIYDNNAIQMFLNNLNLLA